MKEYTIKQISKILGVSKPTAQKIADRLEIKPVRVDKNNCRFYSFEDTQRIVAEKKPNFDFSAWQRAQNEGEKLQSEPQNFAPETAKAENEPQNFAKNNEKLQNFSAKPENEAAKLQNEEIELLRRSLAIIEKQLDEKEKQLAIKDKQIQDLSDRLAEAMQLTRGAQYITAADKTAGLIEADTRRDQQEEPETAGSPPANTENTEPQKKKSFWQRLFGI